ncbi:MAG: ABC transporter permease, partial [Desulfovibrionales bacterium]|nr:ABC transporter permease [Desulfovibrionales bacterium]
MIEFLQKQLRAIIGIFIRQFKIFTRYPMNAIFRIFEPIIWFTPIYFMGKGFAVNGQNTGFAAYTGTGDYVAFLLLGSILASYVSAVLWGIGFSIKTQMDTGVLESNWLTPVPRLTHLIGQSSFSVVLTTLNSCGIALIIWLIFGYELSFEKIVMAILTVLPMLVAIYGFGFGFAALVMLIREANTLIDTGNFIINILSGARFPITVLPRFLMVVSLSIPLTYGYDAV